MKTHKEKVDDIVKILEAEIDGIMLFDDFEPCDAINKKIYMMEDNGDYSDSYYGWICSVYCTRHVDTIVHEYVIKFPDGTQIECLGDCIKSQNGLFFFYISKYGISNYTVSFVPPSDNFLEVSHMEGFVV
jgi:hypothetical protein